MKKLIAILSALCLLCTAAAVLGESAAPFTFRNGVTFGMNMDDVIAAENSKYYEIDNERTHGPVEFWELEYEHITENNARADLTYLFVGNELVAIRLGYETRDIRYEQVKADLTAKYGEPVALDLAKLANGVYAVDDDGRPEGRTEAWVAGNLMVVTEVDHDDIDVTYVDLGAGYVNAR